MNFIKRNFLTTNALKIIACISMLIDHIGYFLFPNFIVFRIIGRLAFPIFAYFIAKGCIYTKNKFKRFIMVFSLGAICEIFSRSGNVLLVFSLSIVLIYSYKFIIDSFKNKDNLMRKIGTIILFLGLLIATYFIDYIYPLDYGFMGIILPLIVYIGSLEIYGCSNKIINKYMDVISIFIGVTLLMFTSLNVVKIFSYLSIPLLACYNGKKGKLNLKYLFYIFYPLHLVIIYFFTLII